MYNKSAMNREKEKKYFDSAADMCCPRPGKPELYLHLCICIE